MIRTGDDYAERQGFRGRIQKSENKNWREVHNSLNPCHDPIHRKKIPDD
jgi:hypothetical protein